MFPLKQIKKKILLIYLKKWVLNNVHFLKKNPKDKTSNTDSATKIAALLIHAAKIDENYTDKEKEKIKKTLVDLGFDSKKLIETIENAEKLESNSNQILDFTREIKSIDEDSKKKINRNNQDYDLFKKSIVKCN